MSDTTTGGDQGSLTTTFNAAAKNVETGEAGPSVAEPISTNGEQAQPTESAPGGGDQQPAIPGTGTPAGADIAPQFNEAAGDQRLTPKFNEAAGDQRLTPKFNEAAGDQRLTPKFNKAAGDQRLTPKFNEAAGKTDGSGKKGDGTEPLTAELGPMPDGQPQSPTETIASPALDATQATRTEADEADDNGSTELAGDGTNPASGDAEMSPEMHKALEEFVENKADVTTATSGISPSPGQEASVGRANTPRKKSGLTP